MSNYGYDEIKKRIFQWGKKEILNYLKKQDEIEISKNDNEALIIDLTFENCLAQIVVSNPIFAPYQFVSFESMTLDSDKAKASGCPEMVYFFYDTDKLSEFDVITELEMGVQYSSDYIPDLLRKKYFNKQGFIDLECKMPFQTIHPDDIEKIDDIKKNGSYNKFTCIDVKAQYLVVVNNTYSLKIFPQIFKVISYEN